MAEVFPTLMIVPTWIGCEIGGYAGDALPAARVLAAACGCLVTHPNVMNGAALYWSDDRILYVEGWGLDRFAAGELALRGGRRQRVGLLLDAAIEPSLRDRHLQVADACRATLGLDVGPVITTDVALGVTLRQGESGVSWGSLERPAPGQQGRRSTTGLGRRLLQQRADRTLAVDVLVAQSIGLDCHLALVVRCLVYLSLGAPAQQLA